MQDRRWPGKKQNGICLRLFDIGTLQLILRCVFLTSFLDLCAKVNPVEAG